MALPSSVEDYIRSITFKHKTFGGVDEEEVFGHLREIMGLYQRELKKAGKKPDKEPEEAGTETVREPEEAGDEAAAVSQEDYDLLVKKCEELQAEYKSLQEDNNYLNHLLAEAENRLMEKEREAGAEEELPEEEPVAEELPVEEEPEPVEEEPEPVEEIIRPEPRDEELEKARQAKEAFLSELKKAAEEGSEGPMSPEEMRRLGEMFRSV